MTTEGYYRILVPTDFSSCSAAAWAEAQRLARVCGSELVLVHALAKTTFSSGLPVARALGKEVLLEERVDAGLLGGLVVKVGSLMVDTSLRTKLNSLKVAMKEVG